MKTKKFLTITVIITLAIGLLATIRVKARNGYFDQSSIFESEEVTLQKMHTTAYCVGHHTANGSAVHIGGCACNTHLGDIAIVYTTDGEYLATLECNDTGSTEGLKAGKVIDVYFPTYEECEAWMAKTSGKVMVLWVKGEG